MPNDFLLELSSTTPFRLIDGVPNAIWSYSLSWSDVPSLRKLFSAGSGESIGTRIGLEFSRRIKIQDPANFKDVPQIQATQLDAATLPGAQLVYQVFTSAPDSPIQLAFIAPAEQDVFCPIKLVHRAADAVPWSELPFKLFAEGDIAFQQVTTGPAVVCPASGNGGKGSSGDQELKNSSRRVPKATLVSFQLDTPPDTGGAVPKFGFINQLTLQKGEVDAVQHSSEQQPRVAAQASLPDEGDALWDILRHLRARQCHRVFQLRASSPLFRSQPFGNSVVR